MFDDTLTIKRDRNGRITGINVSTGFGWVLAIIAIITVASCFA